MLTDVLDEAALTEAEAAPLYAMRRGQEVFFRSYKQTSRRRTPLSRTPATCLAEARWTLPGPWLPGPLNVSRVPAEGGDPPRCSVAEARAAVRRAPRGTPRRRTRRTASDRLDRELSEAAIDGYRRRGSKRARNYPREKREKPPGPPIIRTAREAEIKKAAGLPPPEIELRWTA